jgi:outer membrane autotransporter protein
LGGDSELILHGYYRSGARTFDRNGAFVNVDTVTTAARIRTGSDNFKFSMEAAYNFETQSGKTSNSYLSFGLGVEPKITDNLWLALSMSGATGKQSGNDVQIFSGLKWNFNNGD